MEERSQEERRQAGFSLIELLIAMAITLVVMSIASNLLMGSLRVRLREDQRSDALADVQRALNVMTREIANSGYRLPQNLTYLPPSGVRTAVPANGLLPGFSGANAVAFVSNLNASSGSNTINEPDEGVLFTIWQNAPVNPDDSFLVRKGLWSGDSLILANRVDALTFAYFDRDPSTGAVNAVPQATPTVNTAAIRITINVTLPAVGAPGTSGYQPPFQTQLISDVALRNGNLTGY